MEQSEVGAISRITQRVKNKNAESRGMEWKLRGLACERDLASGDVVHTSCEDDFPLCFHLCQDAALGAYLVAHLHDVLGHAGVQNFWGAFFTMLGFGLVHGRLNFGQQACDVSILDTLPRGANGPTGGVPKDENHLGARVFACLLYTSPSPRD